MMPTQLFHCLVTALSSIAGSNRGATPDQLYLMEIFHQIVRPDENRRPVEQGKQILKYLQFEIAAWNSEIRLGNSILSVRKCQEAWTLLLLAEVMQKDGEPNRQGDGRPQSVP
jgi:hypothetical protein